MSLIAATYLLAAIFAACGIFSLTAGLAGWEWFFRSMNVRMLTGRLSRGAARMVYIILGLVIIAMSVYMVTGYVR